MFKLSRLPLRAIPELDTIRFLSIVLVVLHHQFFRDYAALSWFTDHGWVGVDIFFGMSGFLITSILIKELEQSKTLKLRTFWYKRMLRLWPSWFFTLGLSFLMVYFISRNTPHVREALLDRWWHYPLHVANYSYIFSGKIHTLFSHFWSLAVEEHFYLLWPLILFFMRTKKGILGATWALILASFAFRLYHLQSGASEHLLSFSTHTRIDELLMGCLLAFYFPRIKELSVKLEIFLTILLLSLFAFGLYVCKGSDASQLLNALTYTVIGFGTCVLIVIALKGGRLGLRRAFQNPLLAKLGVLSYGVYLIHPHVNYLVFPILKRFPIVQDQLLIAAINLILPFIPAYYMFFYLDEYFSKFKPGRHTSSSIPKYQNLLQYLSYTRAFRAPGWIYQKLKHARLDRREKILLDMRLGHKIELVATQSYLERVIYNRSYHDEGVFYLEPFLREGAVILDIGANIGLLTCAYAERYRHLSPKIYAIEAVGQNFRALGRNIELNAFDNISAFHLALGKEKGELTFNLPSSDFMGNAVGANVLCAADSKDREETHRHVEVVPLVTLDEWVRENQVRRCDFMKIDIEGAELAVFEGGRKFIEELRPLIQCEYNKHWLDHQGIRIQDFINFFSGLNYDCFVDVGDKFSPIDLKNFNHTLVDLLFVPKS